jgi:hypothetical protein
VCAVGIALVRPPLSNSSSKVLKDADGAVPVDASIGNGDALLEAAGALWWHLLVTLVDVGFDHDADDASFAVADLVCDILCDEGLVAVVLVGVACELLGFRASSLSAANFKKHTVRAVYHHNFGQALLL